MKAVRLVKYRGWSMRAVARRVGVSPSTILRWCKKDMTGGWDPIETESSAPRNVQRVDSSIEQMIVHERLRAGRCGQVVHAVLARRGISVSLPTVHRVLDRHGLLKKRSPLKRRHRSIPRPDVEKPGDLIQIDTIHIIPGVLYVYTMLDVRSRIAWVRASERINTHRSLRFVQDSKRETEMSFRVLQSDNGSEFSMWFSEHVQRLGVVHRHSRVRRPNDNAHIERFNRTVQDECTRKLPKKLEVYKRVLPEYIHEYNNERHHMSLEYETPAEVLRRWC